MVVVAVMVRRAGHCGGGVADWGVWGKGALGWPNTVPLPRRLATATPFSRKLIELMIIATVGRRHGNYRDPDSRLQANSKR